MNLFAESSGCPPHELRRKAATRGTRIFFDMVCSPGLWVGCDERAGEGEAVAFRIFCGSGDRHDDSDERGVAATQREPVVDQPRFAGELVREHAAVNRVTVEH